MTIRTSRELSRRTVVSGLGASVAAGPLLGWSRAAEAATLRRPDLATSAGKKMLGLYRKAVGMMLDLPEHDPRSWLFQANIHAHPYDDDQAAAVFRQPGATAAQKALALGGAGKEGIWNTCTHFRPEQTNYFTAWHRLYLYHFEKVVESVIGQPFRLPYWNYTDPKDKKKRLLPKEFTEPTFNGQPNPLFYSPQNPLFAADSFVQEREGNALTAEDIRARASLAKKRFTSVVRPNGDVSVEGFDMAIDGNPHGLVHGAVGGSMGSVPTAARDPIFWVHHCNIDRLWESWRRPGKSGTSTLDPNSPTWLNTEFAYAKPDGTRTTKKAGDTLKTSANLGYVYDSLQNVKSVILLAPGARLPDVAEPLVLAASPAGAAASVTKVNAPATFTTAPVAPAAAGQQAVADPAKQFQLVLPVSVDKEPGAVYDVFVKARKSAGASVTEERLVETFSLFGAGHGQHAGHAGMPTATWRAEITDLVRAKLVDPLAPVEVVVKARFRDPAVPVRIQSASIEAF